MLIINREGINYLKPEVRDQQDRHNTEGFMNK